MYVTIPMNGAGIPHKTTVTKIDRDIITLSANCNIAANAQVRFDTPSSKIFPYTLTCPAGDPVGSELIESDYTDNGQFTNDNGQWVVLDATGSDVVLGRSTAKLQVTTTTDNEIEGAQLPIVHVGDGSTTAIVAGRMYRVSMDLDLTTPSSGTFSMQIGLGGTLTPAFDITTTETTYTKDILVTNNTGALLIYDTSATASVFTVDNVSVKQISYKNLTAIAEDNINYKPFDVASTGNALVVGGTSGSSTTIAFEAPGVQFATVGKVISGPGISSLIDGVLQPYVKISSNAGFGAKTIVVAEAQTIAASTLLAISNDPGGATSSGANINPFHVHAAVTTDSGSISSQEIATVYGYLDIDYINGDTTIPVYLQTMLTSAAY